jgi:hypothetical protein
MRSTPFLRAAALSSLISLAWLDAGQAQGSLKDLQRSVRERLLSEGGTTELLYTRVDFSHCAATLQTRTLKRPVSPEVRLTTTFHLASLADAALADSGKPPFVVRISVAGGANAFRQIRQVIDSGKLLETVADVPDLELQFQRPETARLVKTGFARIAKLCQSDDPLLR